MTISFRYRIRFASWGRGPCGAVTEAFDRDVDAALRAPGAIVTITVCVGLTDVRRMTKFSSSQPGS